MFLYLYDVLDMVKWNKSLILVNTKKHILCTNISIEIQSYLDAFLLTII